MVTFDEFLSCPLGPYHVTFNNISVLLPAEGRFIVQISFTMLSV